MTAPSGSLRTVSKNTTNSAEVSTARTPVPRSPHASSTARRLSRQRPRLTPLLIPVSVCQRAVDRSRHRISPLPGRSARSSDLSVKYSLSPGSNIAATGTAPVSGAGMSHAPGTGNLSSGSGHDFACSGSSRAAWTCAASLASWWPQRWPTIANGCESLASSSVSSYGRPSRSWQGTAATLSREPSTQRS